MKKAVNKSETLRARLRDLEAEFERELRARGFDPAQAENVALPSALAKLYAEREEIKAELEGEDNDTREERSKNHE